jgi:hypothetical protein
MRLCHPGDVRPSSEDGSASEPQVPGRISSSDLCHPARCSLLFATPPHRRCPPNSRMFPLTAAVNINQSSKPRRVPIFIRAKNRSATDPRAMIRKATFAPMNQGCRFSSMCACMYTICSDEAWYMMAYSAYQLDFRFRFLTPCNVVVAEGRGVGIVDTRGVESGRRSTRARCCVFHYSFSHFVSCCRPQ